jgi:hypothetical protein
MRYFVQVLRGSIPLQGLSRLLGLLGWGPDSTFPTQATDNGVLYVMRRHSIHGCTGHTDIPRSNQITYVRQSRGGLPVCQ